MLKDTPITIYSVRGFLAVIVSDSLYDLCTQPFGATPNEPLHHGISALDIGGGGALPSTKKVQLSPSGTGYTTCLHRHTTHRSSPESNTLSPGRKRGDEAMQHQQRCNLRMQSHRNVTATGRPTMPTMIGIIMPTPLDIDVGKWTFVPSRTHPPIRSRTSRTRQYCTI